MSYNSGHITILTCEAKMLAEDIRRFAECEKSELNFLDEHVKLAPDVDGYVAINPKKFWWSSEGSGHSWPFFIKVVCPKIVGTIEAVVTWEDGDSHSGLRIKDGKVAEPEVIMTLAPEEP